MKSGLLAVGGVMMILLFSGACASGIPSEEYDALSNKYSALEAENNALKEEINVLKSELEVTQEKVQEYESRLEVAHAYSQFFDVYVDTFRWRSGLPTKYEYAGPGGSPEYLEGLYVLSLEAGGIDFADGVKEALSLPLGEEKDRAWAEFHMHLAENMLSATTLDSETD